MKRIVFLSLAALVAFSACKRTSSSQEETRDDMAQFAGDEAFRQAHDEPEAIAQATGGEMITFPTPDGKTGRAYAFVPTQPGDKFLFVIHEWWGLNDHVKNEAHRLFDSLQQVTVLALDLYDGKIATSQEEAGKFMEAVTQERAEAVISGALAYAGASARVGTIGWCFGGGWSLRASILAGPQGAGCVMYYGMPVQKASELAPLKADILGIFAQQDGWITPKVMEDFTKLAQATGKNLQAVSYNAPHAFANPSNPGFNKNAATQANAMALDFLRKRL